MEPNGSLKCAQNRGFEKKCDMWFGPIIYNIFSLLAPYENLTFSHLHRTKMQVFFAGCLGCRVGAVKWCPRGRKMAGARSPGLAKGAKGFPNASKNGPENRRKSAPLSRTASKGAFRVPWVPQRPQNTCWVLRAKHPSQHTRSPPLLPHTVKHPSSAAVWAYAHLDPPRC